MEKLTVDQQMKVSKAFEKHGNLVKQIARQFAKDKRYEVTDIESYLNEKFIVVVLKYDPEKMSNLGAYLNSTLTRHAINYTNSAEAGVLKTTTPFSAFDEDGDGNEDKPSFEDTHLTDGTLFAEDYVKNDYVCETLEQLFAQATPRQQKIMQAYLKCEGKPSYTQIGKMVGLGHEQVKRELRKLAQQSKFDLTAIL